MLEKTALDKIIRRHQELEQLLYTSDQSNAAEAAKLGREHLRLSNLTQDINKLYQLREEAQATEKLLASTQNDKELMAMAYEEKQALVKQTAGLETKIVQQLLPAQQDDDKEAIIEIRSGTGGEEAALFARELLTLYQRYSQENGWQMQLLSLNLTDLGGVKEASAEIKGKDVFAKLKFESGVHRVQRVPLTESSGRIHTSAATVAVLPIAEETDIAIKTEDLRVDVYRSSGPGGQSVNTTDSAVRVTHIPTGTVVCCQDEKSQHRNKASAMKILRSRLYELEIAKQHNERSQLRKTQVGTGDRSERIRTYNFPQNRVTDHRINFVSHDLVGILNGKIEPLVSQLRQVSLDKQTAQALQELSS